MQRQTEERQRQAEGLIGFVLIAVAVLGLLALVTTQSGCSTTSLRTALVSGGKAAVETQGVIATACDVVERHCTANPCQALLTCQDAERKYLLALKLLLPALTTINEVIPDAADERSE